MNGLLADVNIQGHLPTVRILLQKGGLMPLLEELGLHLLTFPELGLDRSLDDRSLWNFCQQQGWVLFTENRNHDGCSDDARQIHLLPSHSSTKSVVR